jgi:hypothetical protein
VLGIIFLVRVRKLNLNKLFSPGVISGLGWAGITCFVFAVLHYLRMYLINNYVIEATQKNYHLEHFSIINAYTWAGILVTWLYRILQQAEQLQTEQELTV